MVDIVTLSYPLYLTISDIIGKVTQMQLWFMNKNYHKKRRNALKESPEEKKKTHYCELKTLPYNQIISWWIIAT